MGLSLLSGAHMTLVPKVLDQLKENGVEDVVVMVGGIIPEADIPKLKELGVLEVFGPGAALPGIAAWLKQTLDSRSAGHDGAGEEQ